MTNRPENRNRGGFRLSNYHDRQPRRSYGRFLGGPPYSVQRGIVDRDIESENPPTEESSRLIPALGEWRCKDWPAELLVPDAERCALGQAVVDSLITDADGVHDGCLLFLVDRVLERDDDRRSAWLHDIQSVTSGRTARLQNGIRTRTGFGTRSGHYDKWFRDPHRSDHDTD